MRRRAAAAGGRAAATMRRRLPGCGFLAALLGILLVCPARGEARDADPAVAGDLARVASHRGYPAAAAGELAASRTVTVREREGGRIDLRLAGVGDVSLRAGSPFVRYRGRTYQLANAPYRRRGELWIPAELFVRWAPSVAGGAPTYAVRAGRLVSGGGAASPPDRDMRIPESRSVGGPFVVVIDPGHGGRDPGTHGPRGTDEKEVTLAIARKLRDRLERADGIVTVMTRDRDTLIALRDRSRMAMSALNRTYDGRRPSGGLFMSIHANAVARGDARGFETYFLGRATSEQAREVAMRENSAIEYEEEGATPEPDDIRFMLADLDKTQWIIESNRLAGYTQNAMRQRLDSPDRGVKQANYLVLVWASGSMPSVLVETGFLSSRSGERLLRSEDGQARLADSLAEAVESYHRQYRRQIRSTAARE